MSAHRHCRLDRAADGAVRSLILAAVAKQPFLSARHVRALVRDRFGAWLEVVDAASGEVKDIALPGVRVFQIALARWRVAYRNELMRLTDPDGYRSKVEFVATGSQRAERLNEVWQIDASPADVMLKGGRHSVYVAVDVFSRRLMVLVSPTPRAAAVGLLVRKCLIAWGVPERIKTDNGSDFVALVLYQRLRMVTRLKRQACVRPGGRECARHGSGGRMPGRKRPGGGVWKPVNP